jgi:ABC-type spermidine/putrescine transport system permease subunit I
MRGSKTALLLAPPVLFLIAGLGVAVAIFFCNSFFKSGGMGIILPRLTLDNYLDLVDEYYLSVMLNTLLISILVAVLTILIGYPSALYIARRRSWAARVFFLIILASSAMSLVARALGWIGILTPGGPLNQALHGLGVIAQPIDFFQSNVAVVVGLVHGFVPLFVLTLLPVLQAIDSHYEEAAAGMGAGPWTVMWKITLPLSATGVIGGGLLVFAICMGAFTTAVLLSGGSTSTFFPILISQQVTSLINYPMGAAMAVALLLVVLAIVWISILATRSFVYGAARWHAALVQYRHHRHGAGLRRFSARAARHGVSQFDWRRAVSDLSAKSLHPRALSRNPAALADWSRSQP